MLVLSDEQANKRLAMQSGKQEITYVLQAQAKEQRSI